MITCCTAYSVWILVITSNFCITEVRNTTLNSVKSQRQGINRDKFNEDCNGPCSSCLSITIPTKAMGQARNTTPTLALVISGGWGGGGSSKEVEAHCPLCPAYSVKLFNFWIVHGWYNAEFS